MTEYPFCFTQSFQPLTRRMWDCNRLILTLVITYHGRSRDQNRGWDVPPQKKKKKKNNNNNNNNNIFNSKSVVPYTLKPRFRSRLPS